jgi:DNA damage-binding protein 1
MGSVLLYGTISPRWVTPLHALQTGLADSVSTLGNLPFKPYRGIKNAARQADEPYRFVDGELLEKFLELDDTRQAEVAKTVGMELTEAKELVERLKRLH